MRTLPIILIYLVTAAIGDEMVDDWKCSEPSWGLLYPSPCGNLKAKINQCCFNYTTCEASDNSVDHHWCKTTRQDCLDRIIKRTGRMDCIYFAAKVAGDRPDLSNELQLQDWKCRSTKQEKREWIYHNIRRSCDNISYLINDCCSEFELCNEGKEGQKECADQEQRCIDRLTVDGNEHCREITDHIVERDALDNTMPGFEQWACLDEREEESRRLHAQFATNCYSLQAPVSGCCRYSSTAADEKACIDNLLDDFKLEEECRQAANLVENRQRKDPAPSTDDDDSESTTVSVPSTTTSTDDDVNVNIVIIWIKRVYQRVYNASVQYVVYAEKKIEKNPAESIIVFVLVFFAILLICLGCCCCCIACIRVTTHTTVDEDLESSESTTATSVKSRKSSSRA